MDCRKCYRPLQDCDTCLGQAKTSLLGGRLSCRNCNSTGLICAVHGGHWK